MSDVDDTLRRLRREPMVDPEAWPLNLEGRTELLDDILQKYLVDHCTIDEIIASGIEASVVHRVVELVHRNEYKRSQAPPILKITDKAFGCGWRYPLAASVPT